MHPQKATQTATIVAGGIAPQLTVKWGFLGYRRRLHLGKRVTVSEQLRKRTQRSTCQLRLPANTTMPNYICRTCATQFSESPEPPASCPICEDERQYVPHNRGQQWTTRDELLAAGHRIVLEPEEAKLVGVGVKPSIAIGQRGLLFQTERGNVLWDCVPEVLTPDVKEEIEKLGGISVIACSHPHFYSAMVDWAERFSATIYLHEADRRWVMRPHASITFWKGETQPLLGGALALIRVGGHFPGSSALLWTKSEEGGAVLATGDTVIVVPDRRYVSFMYSYPNYVPLPAKEVARIQAVLKEYSFDRLYAGWFGAKVGPGADQIVQKSAQRYIDVLEGRHPVEQYTEGPGLVPPAV